MRLAIVNICIGLEKLFEWSRPLFKRYADKVNADLVVITEPKIKHPICPMLEKYQIYDALVRYDRVIHFDIDIIVRPETPNMFDLVPYTEVGAVFDVDTNYEHNTNRKEAINTIQRQLGQIGWENGYINSGVIVLSKVHRDVYKYDERLYKINQRRFLEQNFTNYNIQRNKFPIHKLDRSFNRIAFGGSEKEYYEKGKLAYVIHFAGRSSKLALLEKYYHIVT